jgi:hypothetical protein
VGAVYADWHRLRTHGGVTAAQVAYGRKVLGELMESLRLGDLPTGVLRRAAPDGTLYVAVYDGVTPTLEIVTAAAAEPEEPVTGQLWVPRGFVVYPAWHDKPFGVGLPVAATGDDPYSAANLAPGLDPSRWTAAGPCGEVLISPDDKGGYPDAGTTPAPLMYDEVYGPRPIGISQALRSDSVADGGAQWASYRCEFPGFQSWEGRGDASFSRQMFEYVNSRRDAVPVTASWLPFRGYTDVAFDAAVVLSQYNLPEETSPIYPANYANSAIRLSKDGYPSDLVAMSAHAPADFNRSFYAKGVEFGAVGLTVPAMFNAWQAASSNVLTSDLGPSSQLYAARVGAFAITSLTVRDRWINAGNAYWKGRDAALPPVSWHGFASVNLGWETYPVYFDRPNATTAPLVIARNFTDGSGDCWLRYARNTTEATPYFDAAMGRHIYARGRSIALAPRGGLIWGACVLSNGPVTDRLVALVHHPEDQPSDTAQEGFTRYVRVWWCDIPRRNNGLSLAPPMPICGEDASDPWRWRGGEQIDLGSMSATAYSGMAASTSDKNSLKYASCWRFNRDGTRAVCLRDYASYLDYQFVGDYITSYGAQPRVVELSFSIVGASADEASDGDLDAAVSFHDFLAAQAATPELLPEPKVPGTDVEFGSALYDNHLIPLAVDFDDADNLVFAFGASYQSSQAQTYDAGISPPANDNWYASNIVLNYVGIGGAGCMSMPDLVGPVLSGCSFKTPLCDRIDTGPLVLDVLSGSFALQAARPRFALNVNSNADPTLPPAPELGLVPDYPCQTFTSAPVHGVLLTSGGVIESEDWYPNPDGTLLTATNNCYPGATGATNFTFLPLAMSFAVQGFHVERFGEVVRGYQVSPAPGAAWEIGSIPSSPACGCLTTDDDANGAAGLTYAEVLPRGGKAVSTLALPDNDWLIYAKAV